MQTDIADDKEPINPIRRQNQSLFTDKFDKKQELPIQPIQSYNINLEKKPKFNLLPLIVQKIILDIMDSKFYLYLIFTLTIFVLVNDDIMMLSQNQEFDYIFFMFSFIAFLLFSFELILQSMILDSYFLSAVFWIELLVTLSLILDIKWISNSIPYNNGLSVYENLHYYRIYPQAVNGIKLARFYKVIKILRLIKLYKISQYIIFQLENKDKYLQEYLKSIKNKDSQEDQEKKSLKFSDLQQQTQQTNQGKKFFKFQKISIFNQTDYDKFDFDQEKLDKIKSKQMQVGKSLSNLTMTKVISLFFLILISVPLFDIHLWHTEDQGYENGLKFLCLQLLFQKYQILKTFQKMFNNYYLQVNYQQGINKVIIDCTSYLYSSLYCNSKILGNIFYKLMQIILLNG